MYYAIFYADSDEFIWLGQAASEVCAVAQCAEDRNCPRDFTDVQADTMDVRAMSDNLGMAVQGVYDSMGMGIACTIILETTERCLVTVGSSPDNDVCVRDPNRFGGEATRRP